MNTFKKQGVSFVALGGAEEIGMNLYAYVVNGKIIVVDCGYQFLNDSYPGMDLSLADFSFLEKHKEDILGIFITHAHEDHFGAIGYVLPKLGFPPVYGSNFVLGLIKRRLKEFNCEDAILISEKNVELGSFNVSFINLIHSVPENAGLFIKTPYGNVFHASDWRFDDEKTSLQKTDYEALEKAKEDGIDIFVCDSTNVLEDSVKLTESQIKENLIKLISGLKNTVVATCFASNLSRVESLILAAHEAQRTPVLMGRSLVVYMEVAKECGYFQDLPPFIVAERQSDVAPENALYITTGSQANYRSGLVRIANDEHKYIKLTEGDTVVFSSRKVEGNEEHVIALEEKFIKMGVNVISGDDYPIHTSGHGGKDDFIRMYDILKPKAIVPIHGEKRFIREHKKMALEHGIKDVVIVNNGDVLLIKRDEPLRIYNKLETNVLGVDRGRLIPLDSQVVKNRRQIMYNGSVFISFAVDKEWNPIDVKISSKDILEEREFAELRDQIEQELMIALPEKFKNLDKKEGRIIDFVRVYVRKRILKATGLNPVPFIHMYQF